MNYPHEPILQRELTNMRSRKMWVVEKVGVENGVVISRFVRPGLMDIASYIIRHPLRFIVFRGELLGIYDIRWNSENRMRIRWRKKAPGA